MEDRTEPGDFAAKYDGMETLVVIHHMNELKGEKERLEAELKKVNGEYNHLRLVTVPERFEEEGIESVKVEGVGRVTLTGDMHVSILAANRGEAYDYLEDIGKGSLITKTVNASTLKAAVKEMLKQGEELPEGLIKVTPFTRASITRS